MWWRKSKSLKLVPHPQCPIGGGVVLCPLILKDSKYGGLRPPSISPCGAPVLAPGCRGPSAPFSQSLWYTYKATIYSSSCILVIKREIQDMAEGGTNRPLEMTTQGVGEGERLSCDGPKTPRNLPHPSDPSPKAPFELLVAANAALLSDPLITPRNSA